MQEAFNHGLENFYRKGFIDGIEYTSIEYTIREALEEEESENGAAQRQNSHLLSSGSNASRDGNRSVAPPGRSRGPSQNRHQPGASHQSNQHSRERNHASQIVDPETDLPTPSANERLTSDRPDPRIDPYHRSLSRHSQPRSLSRQSERHSANDRSGSRFASGKSKNRSISNHSERQSVSGQSRIRSGSQRSERHSVNDQNNNHSVSHHSERHSVSGQSKRRSSNHRGENHRDESRPVSGQSKHRSVSGQNTTHSASHHGASRSVSGQSKTRSVSNRSESHSSNPNTKHRSASRSSKLRSSSQQGSDIPLPLTRDPSPALSNAGSSTSIHRGRTLERTFIPPPPVQGAMFERIEEETDEESDTDSGYTEESRRTYKQEERRQRILR